MLLCGYFWWVYLCKKHAKSIHHQTFPIGVYITHFLAQTKRIRIFQFSKWSPTEFLGFCGVQKNKLTNRKKKLDRTRNRTTPRRLPSRRQFQTIGSRFSRPFQEQLFLLNESDTYFSLGLFFCYLNLGQWRPKSKH